MKTPLIYGLYLALAGLLLNLGLFLAGYHSDAEKMMSIQWPTLGLYVVIAAVVIVLGIKARRAEIPLNEDFGYGRALWAGVLIGIFSCVFGIVTNLLYTRVINRGFNEIMAQGRIAQWEASGMSQDRIDKSDAMMRSPVGMIIGTVVIILVFMLIYTVISLIAAAFLKRPAQEELVPPATI